MGQYQDRFDQILDKMSKGCNQEKLLDWRGWRPWKTRTCRGERSGRSVYHLGCYREKDIEFPQGKAEYVAVVHRKPCVTKDNFHFESTVPCSLHEERLGQVVLR